MRRYTDYQDFDFVQEFTGQWNKRLKSIRIASIIAGILMIAFGVVLFIFPTESIQIVETMAAILIMALGVYQLLDYCYIPVFLRRSGLLVCSILNILLGLLLLTVPQEITVVTFAFLFGMLLLCFGIDMLGFSSKLGFFGVTGYGWVVATGICSVIAAIAFLCIPFASTLALNLILAFYLLIGGIAVLVEASSMKNLKMR